MMGLEKLLRGLYGSEPQIDMDQQIARSRVPKPQTFDFAALSEGLTRNNVGTAYIRVEAEGIVRAGRLELRPTGQALPLEGAPPDETAPSRRRFEVLDWGDPAKLRVRLLP